MPNPVSEAASAVANAPVIKVVTAHPVVSLVSGVIVIFLALLIDALVAAFTPTRRGLFERIRGAVDKVVGGVQRVAGPQQVAPAAVAGRG